MQPQSAPAFWLPGPEECMPGQLVDLFLKTLEFVGWESLSMRGGGASAVLFGSEPKLVFVCFFVMNLFDTLAHGIWDWRKLSLILWCLLLCPCKRDITRHPRGSNSLPKRGRRTSTICFKLPDTLIIIIIMHIIYIALFKVLKDTLNNIFKTS